MFKRFYFTIILLALISLKSFSQSISNYSFSSTSGSFNSLSGGTVPSLISGLDDGYMNGIPIGFDFFYMGDRYTTLSLSTNGWILLGSDITNAVYVNNLKTGTQRPIIAPLWDDLQLSASTDVSYLTSGSAGSRVLTVEVLNLKWDYSQSNASMSFQVKLYESTGKIEFIYNRESAANGSASASIGITGTSTGNGNYLSLNGSGSSPSVSSTTETTNISSRPSNGRTFTFSQTSPTAPGSLSYNSITTTSLKLNWTDNSANETAFVIYSSTDGINYTYLAQTSANATSYTATGLTSGTTYYHRVYALREGALSNALSGNQATSCVPGTVSGTAVETCVGGSTGSITASATGGSAPYTYNLDGGSYQASATFTSLAAGTHTLNAKGVGGCIATTSVTVYDYGASADNQNSAGNDSWVGHAYDGTNFSTYIGNFTETESFNELFGGDYNCFGITSNSIARSIYTESFSVKYRMNSTRRGLYAVDLGSDDGSRLTIDGAMIYNNWVDQGFSTRSSQMINLTGSSSLLYEFYENGGGNQVMFQNITTLISNVLLTNTSQNICLGSSGASISGNIFGSLPSGIALSGTGYQWTYSTSPGGARTNISGATSATYTPSTAVAPFNASGTYYIYRNAKATSANNIGYGSYTATNESNTATIVVNTPPSATISYTGSPFCTNAGTVAVNRTGTAGGTYSATGGLSINAGTGTITPSTSTAGTYTVTYTVAASGGCSIMTTTTSVTISAVPSLSATTVQTCVGGSTGSITALASGGSSPYTYSLNAGTYQASTTFGGLAAGTYTLNVKSNANCIASIPVIVSQYANSADNQSAAATDSWIGHMYDGTNFVDYIGQFTEPETFNELFGGNTTCFNVVSNAVTRSIYTETFSVKYRMNSTRRGLYVADLGSDDGSRLTVDGTMVYANWINQSFSTKSSVLFNLTGSSSLLYEFYEDLVGNQVIFQNFTLVLANSLSTNTSQSICLGNTGTAISGDTYGTLPGGISLSGTGYQWTYSTSPGGARSNITGATGATFTPNTGSAPFNAAGTYYIYRNAILSSTNNVSPVTYVATNESNAATIVVNTAPSATISYTGNPYCASAGLAAVTRTGTTGGSYSITGGLSINSSTGDVTLTGATAGSYTVTYTIAASGGCSIYSVTAPVQLYTINNNQLDYTNGSHGTLCTTVAENATATLTAPSGAVFTTLNFASYGTPSGSCGSFATGSCHATTSQSVAESYLLGNNTGSIPATNGVFGDPCNGTVKSFFVQATYTKPICSGTSPGTLTGTTPTGGNGVYTYLWESSTTSATSGFSAASGTNNSKDYVAGTLTQTTWYRRSVLSGGCTNISAVMIVVVNATPAATISYSGTPFCKSAGVGSVTRSGTSGGTYTAPTGLTINASSGAVTPSSSTAGIYLVTYTMSVNGCSAIATTSVTITATPSATISYSGTPYCSSAGIATVTRTGTAGGAYSSTGGLSINSSTGAINLSASTAGSYTVTYTVAAAGGCSIYTTTTSITITTQPAAYGYYAGTPYCSNTGGIIYPSGAAAVGATGTLSSTAGLSLNSSNGGVNILASTPGSYTVTYTVTASGGCALYQTSTPINIVAPGTWTGSVDDNWSNSGNWLCGAIPTITQDVTIHNGLANYPVVVAGTGTVKNLTIENGASIVLAGGGLQISGTISNLGTFDVTAGTIELNGSSTQTIPANTFTKDTILNLIVNNNVTLGDSLTLSGTLTVGISNKTFATNGYLTLQSSSTGTAKIAPLPVDGSGNATSFITGNVTVERFIPGSRAWRLLTSPLSNTGSIYDSWQNSGTYTPGKGMFVTGPNPQPSNGLDVSPLNTISMKSYNSGTQGFANISDTKSSNLSNSTGNGDNIGYFVFVRGDRTPGNITAIAYNSTVLSGTGLLQTGKQTFNTSGTLGNFTIVGNPYASPVDFNDVQRTHLMKRFYAWDASINQLGAYVIVDDIDGDGTFTKSIPSSSQDNHIQSGQAFFVLTDTAGAASLSFYENSKSTISKNAGFRPLKGLASMSVILNLLEPDNSVKTADAVVAEFNDNFSLAVNTQDAIKFGNINETFSLMRNGSSLGIERRPLINAADTLFLKLTKSTRRNYQFVINAKDLNEPNLFGYLEDAYTKITTPVNLNGSTTVNFTIDASAASINADRFKIVFKQTTVLPVSYKVVNASKQGKDIAVQWKVENQLNIRSYEVEKSTDGSNFTKVNTQSATTSSTTATYNWLDKNAATGDNFYRIRNIDLDGSTGYSKVVKVGFEKEKGGMVVYPNPVKNAVISLQLNDKLQGQYNYRLLNSVGQVLLTGSIDHLGGNVNQKIKLNNQITKGVYHLEVTETDNSKTIIQVVVE
ncbi:hypothetical protein BH11BAC3_BH11BAC3_33550 [soil metagenome]